jgi:DNA polymerase III alpha subunit
MPMPPKGYADRAIVIADMVTYAEDPILVRPARGSSRGSLVCYCIVGVGSVLYGRYFRGFIDAPRHDLPGIDAINPKSQSHSPPAHRQTQSHDAKLK